VFDLFSPILLIILFLCWGSFLNVVGYRLIQSESLWSRSRCIHCKHTLAWYDLMPLVSYLFLRGKCRSCTRSISLLYPLIELLTALTLLAGYYLIDPDYYLAYFILFSALIVTIRTDLESMLISRWVTIVLIPLGILFSLTDHTPIMPLNSIMGAAVGYISLWLIGTIFYAITKKEGIGQGDFDLLALVGSFTGLLGVWGTLLLGSVLGTIGGTLYLLLTGSLRRHAKVPFGPFLALGAILYVCFHERIIELLLGN
jgi:leader peptidase (prepilin peptidase)/N-methyltransferase